MDHLTLGKIILATPWLIWLSVYDFRKHQLPNAWVFGESWWRRRSRWGLG
ncbi:MAG: hypothetical protein L6W00_03460 [Lentisphaeria bacterium]|nr:MAG: hypothetical protein L6W00_03460 [Lentisphaeria bacterium]